MPAPSFGTLAAAPLSPPTAGQPIRVALFADLAGRATARPAGELAKLKPVRVDPDDLDSAIAAVNPKVTIAGILGGPLALSFDGLEDFHPDALCRVADKISDLDGGKQKSDYMKAILRHAKI